MIFKTVIRKKQPEFELQKSICKYLDLQYPNVLYLSDTVATLKLTKPQQGRNKAIQKKGFHCPDIIILKPNKEYHGLLIELKVNTPYKLNGSIKASKENHLENQQNTINDLIKLGYYSTFSWSYDMTIEIIKNYLTNNKTATPKDA